MALQKENYNAPATKLRGPQYCDLTDKEFKIAGLKNSISYKETQKGNSMNSGIKLKNRRSSLPKR